MAVGLLAVSDSQQGSATLRGHLGTDGVTVLVVKVTGSETGVLGAGTGNTKCTGSVPHRKDYCTQTANIGKWCSLGDSGLCPVYYLIEQRLSNC